MKRIFLLPLLGVVGALAFTPSLRAIDFTEASAASSSYPIAKLPTTIDLNPVSETDIRAYYSALDGKNLYGDDLLKALKPILKNGQEYHSYDSSNGRPIWQAYEITDRDWELSPASETQYGTYDAATNRLVNYQYGTGYGDPKNNPYQHLYYRNRGVEKARWRAWDHHGDNAGTDREHIWPKGHGFGGTDPNTGKETTAAGARGDLHHLVAADSYVNSSSHNYYSYGFVDPAKRDDDAGEKYKIDGVKVVDGNYRGTSQTLGSGIVFEPQDCDKGDIARACFYMVARYNNLAGNDDTIDGGNPNLTLIDELSPKESVISTATNAVGYGLLKDLLAWHRLDPVDDYEIHRNDLIYRNYEKNRNPFIDFPEWVDAIWGSVTLGPDNRTHVSRDDSAAYKASHKAAPSTDKVYQDRQSGGDTPTPTPTPTLTPTPTPSSNTQIPLWVWIAVGVGAAVVLVVFVVILIKSPKARKATRKAVKGATKGSRKSSGSTRKSSSKGRKRK